MRALDLSTGIWMFARIVTFIGDYSATLQWLFNSRDDVKSTTVSIPNHLRRQDPTEWTILPPNFKTPILPRRSVALLAATVSYIKSTCCKDEEVYYDTNAYEPIGDVVHGYILENDPFRQFMIVSSTPPGGTLTERTRISIEYFQLRAQKRSNHAKKELPPTRRFSESASSDDDSPPRRDTGPSRRVSLTGAENTATASPNPVVYLGLPVNIDNHGVTTGPLVNRDVYPALPVLAPSPVPERLPCAPCSNGVLIEGMVVTSDVFPDKQYKVLELSYTKIMAMAKTEYITRPSYKLEMEVHEVTVVEGKNLLVCPPCPRPAAGPALVYWAFSALRQGLMAKFQSTTAAKGVNIIHICEGCPELLTAFGLQRGPKIYSANEHEQGACVLSNLDNILGDNWDIFFRGPTVTAICIHHLKLTVSPAGQTFTRFIKALIRTIPVPVTSPEEDYRQIVRDNLVYSQDERHLHLRNEDDEGDDDDD